MDEMERLVPISKFEVNHSKNEKDFETKDCKFYKNFCLPTRYILSIWGFLGFTVVYILRVNLSVAIISMVNSSAINTHVEIKPECQISTENQTKQKDGPFVWDQEIQGIILGAFFWGYIPLQVPAGWLAVKIGGKWLFGIGVLWTSVLTLLTPVAAWQGYGWLIALRVLEGAGESVTYPAMHSMLGYWAPDMETTIIGCIVYSGTFAGLVFGMLVSSVLIETEIMGGWPSAFYLPGVIGIIWFLIWSFVAYSRPAYHPRISQEERKYIESSIQITEGEESSSVPWKAIFLSLPVWAISASNFGSMWCLYTLLTSLPQYFKYILGFSMSTNGLLNTLPYFLSGICFVVSGILADLIRSQNWLNTTITRKLFNTCGMFINAIFIVAICFIDCDQTLVVTCLCLAMALGTLYSAGYNINHLDLAPQYAGVLYGITNAIGTISGIMGPYVVGVLTNNNETRKQWKMVFYISSVISVLTGLFYLIFGNGNIQSWAAGKSNKKTMKL